MAKPDTKKEDDKSKKGKSLTIREQIEGAQAKTDKKTTKKEPEQKVTKGKKAKQEVEDKSFLQAFWHGFTLPLRWIWKVLRIPLWPVIWVLKHIIPVKYFVSSWKELKLVTWPSMKDTFRLTAAVIIFSVVFGVIIAAVDYGLDKLFRALILK